MKRPLFWICLIVISFAGTIYTFVTPKLYQSEAQVVLMRLNLEHPNKVIEESRNRWVWLRDGLALKSALLSDQLINHELELRGLKQDIRERESLLKNIRIDFTGADEFAFNITVKDQDPKRAQQTNQRIVERLRMLAVERHEENYTRWRKHLLKTNPELTKELDYFYELEQLQRQESFQVIQKPTYSEQAVWPHKKGIILLSLGLGVFVGLGAIFVQNELMKSS